MKFDGVDAAIDEHAKSLQLGYLLGFQVLNYDAVYQAITVDLEYLGIPDKLDIRVLKAFSCSIGVASSFPSSSSTMRVTFSANLER